MGLGTNGESKTFLSVSFGKIRQKSLGDGKKVDEHTQNAKMRKTNSGNESWALEYDYIEGTIDNIFLKEDREYGNSFEVVISDIADRYQLSFKEDSRFWFGFASKLPNVELGKRIKITAYDFEDNNGKRRVGVSLIQDGEKVPSYYVAKDGNEIMTVNGYPSGEGIDWKDLDDIKTYQISVKKFLRKEFKERIEPNLGQEQEHQEQQEQHGQSSANYDAQVGGEEIEDDLPF